MMKTSNSGFREKQIICGLFLSKFDRNALTYLGLESFVEAFNVLGYGIQAKPMSIKNYRDELEPYFPNDRVGRHQRKIRDDCRKIFEEYGERIFRLLATWCSRLCFHKQE